MKSIAPGNIVRVTALSFGGEPGDMSRPRVEESVDSETNFPGGILEGTHFEVVRIDGKLIAVEARFDTTWPAYRERLLSNPPVFDPATIGTIETTIDPASFASVEKRATEEMRVALLDPRYRAQCEGNDW